MLDSDDRWHPEYLSSQVAILESDPALDVVYPDALRFTSAGVGSTRYSESYAVGGEISFLRVLARECHIYGEVTARRETLLRAGMYDEELETAEDMDLWLRVLKGGGRIVYNDRVLAYYRIRDGSHTSNGMRIARNILKLMDKLERNFVLTIVEQAALEEQRAHARAELSLLEGKQAIAQGDAQMAIVKLTAAARHHRSWKLLAAITALRIAPAVLLKLYRLRERLGRRRAATPQPV
jgi:hypothetical protein